MSEKSEKIVDISELKKRSLPESKKLDEILNKVIVIKRIEKYENATRFGDIYYIVTSEGERYRSTSKVLNNQLEELKQVMEKNGLQVRCKLIKINRYYRLVSAQ
ncbi:MAG: hypothetical protein JTT12_05425 [Candidatus Brockarchaeota archaeon]|nr:hypothetical protein [Candidatus Brockarchaeota archaeon]